MELLISNRLLILITTFIYYISGFNLDVNNFLVINGPENSEFGYSSLMYYDDADIPW